jgi:hypothetical protein
MRPSRPPQASRSTRRHPTAERIHTGINYVPGAFLVRLCAGDFMDKLTEALVGPWRYEDGRCAIWGWDVAARIDAAGIGSNDRPNPRRHPTLWEGT